MRGLTTPSAAVAVLVAPGAPPGQSDSRRTAALHASLGGDGGPGRDGDGDGDGERDGEGNGGAQLMLKAWQKKRRCSAAPPGCVALTPARARQSRSAADVRRLSSTP